jgi:hypothetical protein
MTKTQKEIAHHQREELMVPPAISYDDIANRAYALYVRRGGEHGHDLEDWLQAEREILEQENSTKEA